MEDFFKYLTPSEEDRDWGLYLNVAGKANIKLRSEYPSHKHPNGYFFTWEKGRILHEYQINYITEGGGVYENDSGKYRIKPGSLLFTRPGVWHRYRPNRNSGWVENYIGFNGSIADNILNNVFFSQLKPVTFIGNMEEIIDSYYRVYELVQDEKPGFQQISASLIMKLLGIIISVEKQRDFAESHIEKIIKKACMMIRENIEKDIDFIHFAEINNIGYSHFRKMFKKYTGIPPIQYQLGLKILRGREILLSSNKSVKEICYELGFQSVYYFSRVFKKKVGVSPTEIRKHKQYQRNKIR